MGIKDWGWGQRGRRKGFPKPVLAMSCALLNFTLCIIFYFGSSESSIRCLGMTQGSVPGAELTAPGGPNLHTMRAVCSPPGSTTSAAWYPYIPELPPPPLWLSIMDSALLLRAAIYQASLQTLLRLWQVQHSVPGRVHNFMQAEHLQSDPCSQCRCISSPCQVSSYVYIQLSYTQWEIFCCDRALYPCKAGGWLCSHQCFHNWPARREDILTGTVNKTCNSLVIQNLIKRCFKKITEIKSNLEIFEY